MIPDSARQVLDSDALAHVATIDPDGRPQVTCTWAGLDVDEIVIGSMFGQRKLANLERDPRVTLTFETPYINPYGLKEYLVIYGRAHISEGGAAELLQLLARTYLRAGVKFPGKDDLPPGFVIHISVDRISGVGPWAGPTV